MKPIVAVLLTLATLAGCSRPAEQQAPTASSAPAPVSASTPAATALDPDAYRAEIEAWHKRRAEGLQKEDGWLSLVGLYWLEEGKNRFGHGCDTCRIAFPAGTPQLAGNFVLQQGKVTLEPASPMTIDGKTVTRRTELLPDSHEKGPTIVKMGSLQFNVIKRGERYGIRAKDPNAETRTKFKGLEYFPVDPKWRVEARFEKYEPAKKIPITDVTGTTSDAESPGALVFTVDGKEYRLDPIREEDRLFIIFRDATSATSTYQAGRYLYSDMPGADGRVVVDFNRAYNPPCAFTEFATCPLPPLQNRLPIAIEAGEKRYAGGH